MVNAVDTIPTTRPAISILVPQSRPSISTAPPVARITMFEITVVQDNLGAT